MNIDVDLRSKVVREAAALLYFGAEKEYKQAKTKAAETFGVHFLPSNFEVALELDRLAEEKEGTRRKERLIQMRKEALKIMKLLDPYCPLLLGGETLSYERWIKATVFNVLLAATLFTFPFNIV